jgi:AcrR family transcriptional regulator
MLVTNITAVVTDAAPAGRRARTRARLLACALDLFERQGYDQTTVAQIAQAAGVTEMTFFRHFASKDRLIVEDPYDPVIAEAVAAQPRTLPPLARTVAGIRAAWSRLPPPESETVRRRVRIAAVTPSLRGAIAANNAATEQILVEQLVADGADPAAARVAAAAVLAGITAALLDWSQHDGQPLAQAVERALDTLEGRSPGKGRSTGRDGS